MDRSGLLLLASHRTAHLTRNVTTSLREELVDQASTGRDEPADQCLSLIDGSPSRYQPDLAQRIPGGEYHLITLMQLELAPNRDREHEAATAVDASGTRFHSRNLPQCPHMRESSSLRYLHENAVENQTPGSPSSANERTTYPGSVPVATGREGSLTHSLHDPG